MARRRPCEGGSFQLSPLTPPPPPLIHPSPHCHPPPNPLLYPLVHPGLNIPPAPGVHNLIPMRSTLQQLTAIARQTMMEASRQPVFLLLSALTLLFIALLPILITHMIGESSRIIRDSSLALLWMAGLLLGGFGAGSTLSRELRRGTLASVLSKPMTRETFFLAKFLGVALVMLAYTAAATMAAMLATRSAAIPFRTDWWGIGPLIAGILAAFALAGLQNFLFRTPFVSRAFLYLLLGVTAAFLTSCLIGPDHNLGGFGHAIPWNILPAGALLALAILVLTAIAVTLATRFDITGTMLLCAAAFLLGLMSDYLLGQRAPDHLLYAIGYHIVPNWQVFWAVDALVLGAIPWSYVASVAAYTSLYLAATLALGLALFRNLEVKA